ncbi:MAG: hypothetical protein NVSMB57_01220 [Actinomycetota bacterium]
MIEPVLNSPRGLVSEEAGDGLFQYFGNYRTQQKRESAQTAGFRWKCGETNDMAIRPRLFAALLLTIATAPSAVFATVDPGCGAQATSAVSGTIQNADSERLNGIRVELRQTNHESPVVDATTSSINGTYRLCVNHDTYDVRALDDAAGLYATAGRGFTTFTNVQQTADFTLVYKLNLTIVPQAISVPAPGSFRNVSWLIRSKAPSNTEMRLTLDHLGSGFVTMPFNGTELGGPANGGWNLWRYDAVITNALPERMYFATVNGVNSLTGRVLTELAKDPYLVDNKPPRFGPQNPGLTSCNDVPGDAVPPATAFTPRETTNPLALISLGVCDPYSNGGSSSLDPYSVQVQLTDPLGNPVTTGSVFLNQLTINYLPSVGFQLGTYKFRFSIKDNAGNLATSGLYYLNVTNAGGSPPTISGVQPANLGENANSVVVGSQYTTPLSVPVVAFLARDPDGQGDLAIGTLHVRIYGPDGSTLLYDYDPRVPCNPYSNPRVSCGKNSGYFNPGTGRFEAFGFSLQGKPPGLYVASASIEDHGGNSATRTWRWILGAAV